MEIILNVLSPLFTGPVDNFEREMAKRKAGWTEWTTSSESYRRLDDFCRGRLRTYAYHPGSEIYFYTDRERKSEIKISLPPDPSASVPKGIVVRTHLLASLVRAERNEEPRDSTIVACIDGSGAFDFDCLNQLVEAFRDNPNAEVVLGLRPNDFAGMHAGRREIEDFEHYLLIKVAGEKINRALDPLMRVGEEGLLPDAQAGCWGFRLSCADRLPLTANGYEIEYDILSSAVLSEISIAYTQPLKMSNAPRSTSFTKGATNEELARNTAKASMSKLRFVQRKLRLSTLEVLECWKAFKEDIVPKLKEKHPVGSEEAILQELTLNAYERALNLI